MPPFLHDRLRRIATLLAASNRALRAYTSLDPALDDMLVAFLDQSGAVYAALGFATAENEVLALRAEFASARAGVHPVTLERVTQRRREMERTIALRVLLAGADLARRHHTHVQEALARAGNLLLPIVAYLVRTGALPPATGHDLTEAELAKLWQLLVDGPETGPAARSAAVGVHRADVLLLLGDLVRDPR